MLSHERVARVLLLYPLLSGVLLQVKILKHTVCLNFSLFRTLQTQLQQRGAQLVLHGVLLLLLL